MSYIGRDGRPLGRSPFGCGSSCDCAACQDRLGETYIEDEPDEKAAPERPAPEDAAAGNGTGPPRPRPAGAAPGPVRRPLFRRRGGRPRFRRPVVRVPPRLGAYGPAPRPGGYGETACPVPARVATQEQRCLVPQTCPPVPGLMCVREIDGVPFEYLRSRRRDPATGLFFVDRRVARAGERFTMAVAEALRRFLRIMARHGLPIEALITLGSYNCRCVTNTSTLSDHARGDAIDIAGVRWRQGAPARLPETLVLNVGHPGERALLRRVNACLRLAFPTVIDYHYNRAHHDHFHCDMNGGRGRSLGPTTMVFVQEALGLVLGRSIPSSRRLDPPTLQALAELAGPPPAGRSYREPSLLHPLLDRLFAQIASGAGAERR